MPLSNLEMVASVESVLSTDELRSRASRPPDHAAENRALLALAGHMADSPHTVLQKLAEIALEICRAGSAGVSLISDETGDFYWPAIAGAWEPHVGGGTPRNFGPCGIVLDRDAMQLFTHPERCYPYLVPVEPPIAEALLTPFYVKGKAVGTVWVVAHDEDRKFDAEDLRLIESLGRFAAAAYPMRIAHAAQEQQGQELRDANATLQHRGDDLRELNEALLVSSVRQHELTERADNATTELRGAKEVAETASRSKDRFLAVLSHELRTPLTPVLLVVSARELDPDLPPSLRDDLKMIRRNVELEVRLIDDLLDLSRITTGKLRLTFDMLDVNDLVRHVCEMCQSNVREKGIQLRCHLDPDARAVVGDPGRLQQVFWNLLNNAMKFTPQGGQIHITTENILASTGESSDGENSTGDGQEGLVRVTVRDTGMGIAPDILLRVFDAFEQGDARITRQFGGMGLGLAISKALVEQHRGSIRVESAGAGKGSTFIVEIPALSRAEEAAERPAKPPPRGDDRTVGRLHVLIVEDHEDTAKAMRRLLTISGHDVKSASTGAGALALAGTHAFDLLLSDLGLPDMTGYELMRQLKQDHGIQGIAMSGYGMEDDIRRSEQAGFSHHLVKPVSIAQIQAAILRVVGTRA